MGGKLTGGMRISAAALTCLALIAAGCGAGRSGSAPGDTEGALLEAGPVLAGDQVVWGEGAGDRILLWSGSPDEEPKLLYRKDSEGKKRPDWRFTALEASPSRIAFVRDWSECWEPPPKPNEARQEGGCAGNNSDLWTARPGDRFAPVYAKPRDCDFTGEVYDLDVSEDSVIFSETYCRGKGDAGNRVAERDYGADRLSTLSEVQCCAPLARLAGRYAAWFGWPPQRVVVYDRVAGRVAYVAKLLPRVYLGDTGLDLQEDGTLIVIYRTRAELPNRIDWFSVDSPKPHSLDLRASSPVRLSDGRFVFERSTGKSTSELVLATLDGQTRSLAKFDRRALRFKDFDFDGRLVTWATAVTEKTKKKCDFPPPGSRKPGGCFLDLTGRVEIWVADIRTDAEPRLVARRGFEDVGAEAFELDEVVG
jgi:hypothetical protein